MNRSLTLKDGAVVPIMVRADGYVNITQICKASGKKFNDWHRLNSSDELINAVSTEAGIPASVLLDITKGGDDLLMQGTYGHPLLAVQIAQWCSPMFAIQVSKWTLERMQAETLAIQQRESLQIQENAQLRIQLHEEEEAKEQLRKEKEAIEQGIRDREHEENKHKRELEELKAKLKAQRLQTCTDSQLKTYEYIYIITTDEYQLNTRYKVGRTDNLTRRHSEYNSTGVSVDSPYYYVYTRKTRAPAAIESIIKCLLARYREVKSKEIYNVNGVLLRRVLDRVIDMMENGVDDFNTEIVDAAEYYEDNERLEPIYIDELRPVPQATTIDLSPEDIDKMLIDIAATYSAAHDTKVIRFSEIRGELANRLSLTNKADIDQYKTKYKRLNKLLTNSVRVNISY